MVGIYGLVMLASPALAGEIPAWSQDSFPGNDYLVGNDGWIGGYEGDPWAGVDGNGGSFALSLTDDANEDVDGSEEYGNNSPSDNWIVRGDAVRQGVTRVNLFMSDDDGIGLVFNNNAKGTFYLALYSEDSAPPPLQRLERPALVLYRIEDGIA